MALPKLFDLITWHNNTTPALNEDNLNAMSQALEDIDNRVVEVASTVMEDVPKIEDALKHLDPPIRVEKDFTPIQVLTDAIDKNVVDLKAKVEAVQDLHGYSKPWVGGAGKNKLPLTVTRLKVVNTSGTWSGNVYTKGGLTFSAESNDGENVNAITINNGVASERVVFYLSTRFSPPSGQYTISKTANTSSISMVASAYNNTTWVKTLAQINSGGGTFTLDYDGYDRIEIYIAIESGTTISNVKICPQLELGSTATDFEPYTNICPITGHSEVKVTRAGRNLLENSATSQTINGVTFTVNSDGSVTANGTASPEAKLEIYADNSSSCPYNGYILSGCPSGGSDSKYDLRISDVTTGSIKDFGNGVTINVSDTGKWNVAIVIRNGQTVSNLTFKPMIRNASITDTTYEPYMGEVFTIDLDGTRYGGVLDVDTGTLTLTHKLISITSLTNVPTQTEDINRWVDNVAHNDVVVPASNSDKADVISNMFVADSANGTYLEREGISIIPSNKYIVLYSEAWKSLNATAVNAILAETPLDVLCELATPQTITLTAEEVTLLWAYNTLFADTGDISLKYDASGVLRIANAKLDIDTFKSIVAASSDFADFKTRVAAL